MIDRDRLEALESAVTAALDGGPMSFEVIGYGEISTVVGIDTGDGPVACKRLPAMEAPALDRYRRTLEAYLAALALRGVTVAPTELHTTGGNPFVPYCVQPRYPRLLVDDLRSGDEALVTRRAARVVELIDAAVGDRVGLDGQVSNWAVDGHDLAYLDVTTPMIRDETFAEQLDTDLFLASLPWLLRGAVRRFLLGEILSHYYATRPVLLDLVANLHKERLASAIPAFLQAANRVVDPPLTAEEAHRYYRRDALMWEVLQRLRRADRWWQRNARRRRYPFLLPGRVER
jgi:hypothetical protein